MRIKIEINPRVASTLDNVSTFCGIFLPIALVIYGLVAH